MSHPDFQVKVSDMLKAKVTDQLSFENKMLEEIPNLSAEGVSGEILKELEKICMEKGIYSIKIDTHEDNEPMKGFLKKNGFEFCGVIYLDREPDLNAKRVTFEKIL